MVVGGLIKAAADSVPVSDLLTNHSVSWAGIAGTTRSREVFGVVGLSWGRLVRSCTIFLGCLDGEIFHKYTSYDPYRYPNMNIMLVISSIEIVRLKFGWDFEVEFWSKLWGLSLVDICKLDFDQAWCKILWHALKALISAKSLNPWVICACL